MIHFLIGLDIFVILSLFLLVIYLLRYRQASQSIIGKLYIEAITDGLTQLYNHKYFQLRAIEEVERTKRYGHPLSLLMIDIDHFKNFNDSYGHQKGDAVLKKIGWIIRTGSRKVDIAARYGGEEFILLLPETEKKGAIILGERLRYAIETASLDSQQKIGVTVSIGIACFSGRESDYDKDKLIKYADMALYEAKQQGRNRVSIYRGNEEN